MNEHWPHHNEKASQQQLPIAATLTKALELLIRYKVKPEVAIDLGSGCGVDAVWLLKCGWYVVAVDIDLNSLVAFKRSVPENLKHRLTIVGKSFRDIQLPYASLINASFSLPFCRPEEFNEIWQKITKSILPGGIFAGHFFGRNDDWANNQEMTFHKRHDLQKLFENFTIESFDEIEREGRTLGGSAKHWHVFHVVLRKH